MNRLVVACLSLGLLTACADEPRKSASLRKASASKLSSAPTPAQHAADSVLKLCQHVAVVSGARSLATFAKECRARFEPAYKDDPPGFSKFAACVLKRKSVAAIERDCPPPPALRRRVSAALEATQGLNDITVAAGHYFRSDHFNNAGEALAKHFPGSEPSAAPSEPADAGWTPKESCCKGPKGRCAPDPQAWKHPLWRALHFKRERPHRSQYRYQSSGSGRAAKYTAQARTDLNCDGTFTTHTITGSVDREMNVVTKDVQVTKTASE